MVHIHNPVTGQRSGHIGRYHPRVLRRRAALAGCVLAAWFVVFPAAADAAESCPTGLTPPPAQPVTEAPWAQQRFDLDRLTGIADGTGITVAVIDSGVDP